jgi:hypothetical protein
MAAVIYKENDLVHVYKGGEKWLGVVMNVQSPLGYREYRVLNVNTGEIITATRLHLEAVTATEAILGPDFDVEMAVDDNAETSVLNEPLPQPKSTKPSLPTPTTSRFATCSDSDLNEIQLAKQAKNTIHQTTWGVKVFRGESKYYDGCPQVIK